MRSEFCNCLITWYNKNKRDLLWRDNPSPYRVWVSEIILQQTRVEQGKGYFQRFIERFPNVIELAKASEEEVLKLWQGLGYYSRARNLHIAAKTIIDKYNGVFPDTYNEIRQLKGVGDYTAAAIASIAFQLPYPAIDGNVYRVMSRFFGIDTAIDTVAGKKIFSELANKHIDKKQPGKYNEAVMEFGAIVCRPLNPNCIQCPINNTCFAYSHNLIKNFPVKKKKQKQSVRYFHFLFLEDGQSILIHQRRENDIWKNLFQFPLIETKRAMTAESFLKSSALKNLLGRKNVGIEDITGEVIHNLSHQKLFLRFYHFFLPKEHLNSMPYLKVNKKDITKFAVPKPLATYLSKKINL